MSGDQIQGGHQRSAELLWAGPQRGARGPKPSLTLDRIAQAAVVVADAEGLTSLSMQRLATELGCGTMSLYRYVSGKDELITLALDAAIGWPRTHGGNVGWRKGLERWAYRNLAVFTDHPWTLPLVAMPRVMGPNEAAHLEDALRTLSDTGLDLEERLQTVLAVNAYIRGAAGSAEAGVGGDGPPPMAHEMVEQYGKQGSYPHLAATAEVLKGKRRRSRMDQQSFAYGLRRLLDGLEALIASRSD